MLAFPLLGLLFRLLSTGLRLFRCLLDEIQLLIDFLQGVLRSFCADPQSLFVAD